MKPRLRADGIGLITVEGLISKVGFFSLESWYGLPKMRNSVLVGLSDKRFADIQVET